MRVCVFGAGAIGGHIAVRLAQAAASEVQVVARGDQLAAIQEHGLELRTGGFCQTARVFATDNIAEIAHPDIVVVALKAHSLGGAARSLERLGERGAIMAFVSNGIPWWYGARHCGVDLPAAEAAAIDPLELRDRFDLAAVVGGIAYSPNSVVEPGVICCTNEHSRFVFGAPIPEATASAQMVVELFRDADVPTAFVEDIRTEVWRKLRLNVSVGPLAALTLGNNHQVVADQELHSLCMALLAELANTARAYGVELEIDGAALSPNRLPPHRPSLLQDLAAGRPLEVDNILGATLAMARAARVPTPLLSAVTALLSARARFRT